MDNARDATDEDEFDLASHKDRKKLVEIRAHRFFFAARDLAPAWRKVEAKDAKRTNFSKR